MSALVDGRGAAIAIPATPQRIVSLVPSTTETLFALGVGDRVVGVTRYCVHPAEVRALPKVGGTKDADPSRIAALDPDLILGNCEENTRELFDALDPIAPLWAPLPRTVDEAIADLVHTGILVGARRRAEALVAEITRERDALRRAADGRSWRYTYLIWRGPYMSVNDDTFIASMLAQAGGTNALAGHPARFPELDAATIGALDPDVVLLSSEPFPFRERHRTELSDRSGVPRDRIRYVDGELCSWHGARMALAFRELRRMLTEGFPSEPIRAPTAPPGP